MHSVEVVELVRGLAAQGMSIAQIVRQTGLARSTVSGLKNGKYNRRPRPDTKQDAWNTFMVGDDGCATDPQLRRCQGCGGMVHKPCRLCEIRRQKREDEITARLRRDDAMRAARAEAPSPLRA